jgi:thymidylate synthase ThyX
MQVTGHRFILAEFNTHRVFSRNSASSRAIPLIKQLKRLEEDGPMFPLSWPMEQSGMQGGEELTLTQRNFARMMWAKTAAMNMAAAKGLHEQLGIHKSVVNRLLEPFMSHTIIVTATAWMNFFDQRVSPLAQPEIRELATRMQEVYASSTPQTLRDGEWHLPYVEEEDWEAMSSKFELGESMYPMAVMISAARCARVSYLTQEGKRDIDKDIELYDRLVTASPRHWSPLEHVATPWQWNHQEYAISFEQDGQSFHVPTKHLPQVGNLRGWRSLRTTVEAIEQEVTYR